MWTWDVATAERRVIWQDALDDVGVVVLDELGDRGDVFVGDVSRDVSVAEFHEKTASPIQRPFVARAVGILFSEASPMSSAYSLANSPTSVLLYFSLSLHFFIISFLLLFPIVSEKILPSATNTV